MVPNGAGEAASPYAERATADLRNHRGRAWQRQRARQRLVLRHAMIFGYGLALLVTS